MDIFTRIWTHLRNSPGDACFYRRPDHSRDYAEACRRISGFCAYFRETGLRAGQVVALEADKSFEAYCCYLACALYGLTYVPYSRELSLPRLAKAFRQLNIDRILHQTGPTADFWQLHGYRSDAMHEIAPAEAHIPHPVFAENRVLYVMFSSGTTGVPKAIPISCGNLNAYIDSIESICEIQPGSAFSQVASPTFDLSIHDTYLCFCNGGHICPIETREAILAYRFVNDLAINYWMSVPSTASLMFRHVREARAMPTLRISFFLGEALPVDTARRWMALSPQARCLNLYGPTECTVAASYFDISTLSDATPHSIVPIGHPLKHCRLHREPGSGELLLGGDQLFGGYLGDAERHNSESSVRVDGERFYRSGDRVAVDPSDGFLFQGRIDFQVKVRGYRIELEELEAILHRQGKGDYCVVPVGRIETGNYESVAIVFSPGCDEASLRAIVKELFPAYVPVSLYLGVDQVPYNANGKLDRKSAAELLR